MTSMGTNGTQVPYMNNIDKNGVPFNVKSGKYWAVWVLIVRNTSGIVPPEQVREEKFWAHHYSASSREDARDEAAYCRRAHGEKTKIIRQDW